MFLVKLFGMETSILLISSLNLLLTSVMAYKYCKLKTEVKKVHMKYFTEVTETDRMFKKEKMVKIKAQVYLDDLPIGESYTVSEDRTEVVNKEEIHKTIKSFAAPLTRMGIKFLIK
ncbi:MAG TPA: hypothetical protein VNJ01_11215 [Bacteriovoracaceae bacterium]|nr:hypothetical protein [Bacteriovoracaceae bacterium]